MKNTIQKITAVLITLIFGYESSIGNQLAQAQMVAPVQPALTLQATHQTFVPVMIRGMKIDPQNGFNLNFIVDSGDADLNGDELKSESEKLIKYFLTSLSVPEDELWVNLSPFEKDRITSTALTQTEMGRDLLAQDYILKQMTASLLFPEDETGKAFWSKIYEKAYEIFGKADLPVDTFHKIWIVPSKIEVFAQGDTVLILDSKLKVMLEEDYLAKQENAKLSDMGAVGASDDLSEDLKATLRDVILPVIEDEVNNGKNFANLRQIYHALIMAKWFKDHLKQSVLGRVYADQEKLEGLNTSNQGALNKIYDKYLEAFKAGSEGYIREEYDPSTQEMAAKKYVTGGVFLKANDAMLNTESFERVLTALIPAGVLNFVKFGLSPRMSFRQGLQFVKAATFFVALALFLTACQNVQNQDKKKPIGIESSKSVPPAVAPSQINPSGAGGDVVTSRDDFFFEPFPGVQSGQIDFFLFPHESQEMIQRHQTILDGVQGSLEIYFPEFEKFYQERLQYFGVAQEISRQTSVNIQAARKDKTIKEYFVLVGESMPFNGQSALIQEIQQLYQVHLAELMARNNPKAQEMARFAVYMYFREVGLLILDAKIQENDPLVKIIVVDDKNPDVNAIAGGNFAAQSARMARQAQRIQNILKGKIKTARGTYFSGAEHIAHLWERDLGGFKFYPRIFAQSADFLKGGLQVMFDDFQDRVNEAGSKFNQSVSGFVPKDLTQQKVDDIYSALFDAKRLSLRMQKLLAVNSIQSAISDHQILSTQTQAALNAFQKIMGQLNVAIGQYRPDLKIPADQAMMTSSLTDYVGKNTISRRSLFKLAALLVADSITPNVLKGSASSKPSIDLFSWKNASSQFVGDKDHPVIIQSILDYVNLYYSNISQLSRIIPLQGLEAKETQALLKSNEAIVYGLKHLGEIEIASNESFASYFVRLRKFLAERYGYYFMLTISWGDTRVGQVVFRDIYDFQMRKVIKEQAQERSFGGRQLKWYEYLIGRNLFERPAYLIDFVEQTYLDHIVLMPEDYRYDAQLIDQHYRDLEKSRQTGDIDSALWFKQWEAYQDLPDEERWEKIAQDITEYFRIHALQHVMDRADDDDPKIKRSFNKIDPSFSDILNLDTHYEVRVIFRQLLEKSYAYDAIREVYGRIQQHSRGVVDQYTISPLIIDNIFSGVLLRMPRLKEKFLTRNGVYKKGSKEYESRLQNLSQGFFVGTNGSDWVIFSKDDWHKLAMASLEVSYKDMLSSDHLKALGQMKKAGELKDQAMMTKQEASVNGGIDFDTKGVEFTSSGSMDSAMMDQMLNINPDDVVGVTIGNITITPIPSVYRLLGLNDPKEDKDSVPSKPYLKDLAFNRKKNV